MQELFIGETIQQKQLELSQKQNPPKSTDFRGFWELLTRFELVTYRTENNANS